MSAHARWVPLPGIHHGNATANFRPTPDPPHTASSATATDGPRSPASPSTPSRSNRYSWSRESHSHAASLSSLPPNGTVVEDGEPLRNVYEQEVMLGDEVYAFEHVFAEDGREWYRGYVLPFQDIQASAAQATSPTPPEPLVYLGIFPAACIHVKAHTADSQGVLRDAFERMARESGTLSPRPAGTGLGAGAGVGTGTAGKPAMEPVLEEEDESGSPERQRGPEAESASAGESQPAPMSAPDRSAEPKLQPPLPTMGALPIAQDASAAAPVDHLVAEIAYTVRDWNARLPGYLLARRYKLFDTVAAYIKALLVARQQLVARLLTHHEEDELRREIVWTMNRGAVGQGLDIVVRDPATGRVGTVEREADPATVWMSGIELYALQVLVAQATSPLAHIKLDSVVDLQGRRKFRGAALRRPASRSLTATVDTSSRVMLEIKTLITRLPPGDTVEVFSSIYHGATQSYLTEEFRVELDHGVPVGLPIGTRMRTAFRGLRELDSTCFLIVRLVRKGMRGASVAGRADGLSREVTPAPRAPMRTDMQPQLNGRADKAPQTPQLDSHEWVTVTPPDHRIRTPLGCAALALDRLKAGDGGAQDFNLDVFTPREEGMWASVPAELLSNQRGNLVVSGIVDAVVVTAELETSSSWPIPRHIQCSNSLDPFDVTVTPRNDLYLKLWQCSLDGPIGRQLPVGQKSALEVRLEVRNSASGQRLPVLQLGGSSGAPLSAETRSIVLPRASRSLIAELNRVSIPEEQCHALLTVFEVQHEAQAAPRPLGFAFLPLNSAPIAVHADGAFALAIHPFTSGNVETMRYLQLPAVVPQDETAVDSITLRIQNVSERTSNSVVLGLTQRRDRTGTSESSLTELLHLVTFVPPLEIIKYLADLLDAIFAILSGNLPDADAESVQDHVRRALISILDAVQDRRFTFEDDPITSYLTEFPWSATGNSLIKAIRRVVRDPAHAEYRQTAKHLAGLVRFVLASRGQLRNANGGTLAEHLELQLDGEIRGLIADDLPAIFDKTDAKSLGSRILVVQQFGSLSKALMTLYSRGEVGETLVKFADLASIDMTPGKASQAKLAYLIKDLILGQHFQDLELRSMLMPVMCRILRSHLVWTSLSDAHTSGVSLSTRLNTTRQAISAAAGIVNSLSRSLADTRSEQDRVQDEDNLEYVLSALLPHLISCFRITAAHAVVPSERKASAFQEVAIFPVETHSVEYSSATLAGAGRQDYHHLAMECAAVILALLIACPRERLLSYLVEFKEVHNEQETVQFVLSALSFGRDVLQGDDVTKAWWTWRNLARRAFLSLLDAIRLAYLVNASWDEPNPRSEMWIASLSTALRLVQDELRSVEYCSPQQTQTATWREWSRSGDDTAVLLGDLRHCKPTHLPPTSLASASTEVLATCMMGTETAVSLVAMLDELLSSIFDSDGNLLTVQRELVTILDDSLALPNSRKGLAKFIFLEQLRSLHESDAAVGTFVSNVRSMLEVVEGYMGLILRITDSHLAPHEYGVLALEAMSFVRNIQMRALEAKWSSRLHERLVQEGYKSSAGLALAREASCLDWNSERARKEQLLTRAMSELDAGRNWELGVEVCEALIDYHRRQTFDSSRISALLFAEAQMYGKIAKAKPRAVRYYRTTLHNIAAEGGTLCDYIWAVPAIDADAQLRSACHQLSDKYGQVEICVDADSAMSERESHHCYIRIAAYYPVPDRSKACVASARTPNPYYLMNDVSKYRRMQRRAPEAAIEAVEVQTADTLPNILPMSPVTKQSVTQITGLQLALDEVNRGQDHLTMIEAYLQDGGYQDDLASVLALTEQALDLPHSEGIIDARPSKSSVLDGHSASEDLAHAMLNYARRLAKLLQRFSDAAPDHTRSYSDTLIKLFTRNFAIEIASDPDLSSSLAAVRRQAQSAGKPHPPLPSAGADDSAWQVANGANASPARVSESASAQGGIHSEDGNDLQSHSDFGPSQPMSTASSPSMGRHNGGTVEDKRDTSRPESRLSIGSKTSARSRMSARFGSLMSRKPSDRERER